MGSTLRYAGLLLAIVLALVAQQLVVDPRFAAWGWVLFGFAALIAAFSAPALEGASVVSQQPRPIQRGMLRLLSGGAALGAAAVATWLASTQQRPELVFLLWLTTLVLASLALAGTTVAPPLRARIPWTRRETIILLLVCVGAFLARAVWLDDVPRYYFDDESRVGMYVRHILSADRFPNLFSMGWNTWPVLGMVLQGIFGVFAGIDTTTLRWSSAVAGTVAVLFAYLLARELFSPRIALLSTVLFACGRTALDFSRMGICHAQVMAFETLALWSLWRALNRGSGLSYLWTGIALGLCLHTYNAGQLLPLLWLGWIGIALVCAPRLTLQRWRGGLLTAVGMMVTILPLLLYVTDNLTFAAHWTEYTGMARNRQVMTRVSEAWTAGGPAEGLRILGEQARLTWLGFNVLPADAYQLGYRGGGMLDHVSAPLFVLGLAICGARFWTPRYAFMLYWWLLTTVMGGVLTNAPPAFVRMVGILPALALFGALPVDALLRTATSAALRVTGVAAAALLGVAMAWDNFRTYFVIFPRTTSQPSSELTRYLTTTPPNSLVLLFGAEHHLEVSTEIYRLNLGERQFANAGDLSHLLPLRENGGRPVALVFGETQLTLVPYVQSLYPGVPVAEVTERGQPTVLFRAMVIPTERIAARQGLRVTRDGSDEAATANPFDSATPFPGCTQLTWTGGIYWPTDQQVIVHVEAPPASTVLIGPMTLPPTNEDNHASAIALEVPRGWNRIVLRERCANARQFTLRIEQDHRTTAVDRSDLRPDYEGEGLLATYLRNETPVLRSIDAQINAYAVEELVRVPYDVPVRMPFTETWSGSLEIDVPGEYQFDAAFSGPALVTIDGEPLLQETVRVPEEPRTARATRRLEKGSHPLFALWDSTRRAHTSRRIFQLFWMPPNGVREIIPPPRLRPAAVSGPGTMPTISIPPTPTPIALRAGPRKLVTELTPQEIKFGFAAPRFDRAWSGEPISMRGIEYAHGIGAHAWLYLTYAVPPDAVELQAIVGLADDVKDCPRATVKFEIRDERNTLLYDSGIIDVFTPPKLAAAQLTGVKQVTLAITDAGDGIDCDHANWAEPIFLLSQ